MFRFEHSKYLYLLTTLPAVTGLFIYYMKSKKGALKRFGEIKLLQKLIPDIALKKYYIKFWLLLTSTALFVSVIAGPQLGSKREAVTKRGIEIMVCLDVSNSMLSTDITPTRLDKAKQTLSRLVDNLYDNKIGLIVFAGDAYIQLPITSDYISAKMFLSSINPSMVPTQGTNIGAAIQLALKSFSPNEKSEKTIILITDGENHDNNAIKAAKEAAKNRITVNIIGIGLPHGSPIPTANGYLKNNNGNIVLTKLDEKMAQKIAVAGNGIYVYTDNTNNALKVLQRELDKKIKSEIESKVYSSYDEKYAIPGGFLLLLLIGEFFILDRKNRILSKIKLF